MQKILWISPVLTHYKIAFLNKLIKFSHYDIVYLGSNQTPISHYSDDYLSPKFKTILLSTSRKYFGINPCNIFTIGRLLLQEKYDHVLVPIERKYCPLIIYTFFLKFFFRYKLFAYNHALLRSLYKSYRVNKAINKTLFLLLDKVIFYTKGEMDRAVKFGLIKKTKAFFANNTLDTTHIWDNYSFTINNSDTITILFIGKLTKNKKLDLLLKYYQNLKIRLPQLKLIVIGDGPEAYRIQSALNNDPSILWRGGVVDEKLIAADMNESHIVFVPGLSGLSIVHAFCYGKPYVTISDKNHGPEIDYLHHGKNGIILSGQINEDCTQIENLLLDKESYASMCKAAFETAQKLSIDKWCSQMQNALTF